MYFVRFSVFLAIVAFAHGYPSKAAQAPNGEDGPYFQGDIKMTEEEMLHFRESEKSGLISQTSRWPQNTLTYYIRPLTFNMKEEQEIVAATRLISSKTCIKFNRILTTVGATDFVEVQREDSGCWSRFGRLGGSQELNLGQYCFNDVGGIAAHEFIHALGVDHEQNRSDRDKYVDIIWQNLKDYNKTNSNFQKSGSRFSEFGLPYDYGSIMHYRTTAFGKEDANGNEMETIRVPKGTKNVGQREKLGSQDIQLLKKMYKCP